MLRRHLVLNRTYVPPHTSPSNNTQFVVIDALYSSDYSYRRLFCFLVLFWCTLLYPLFFRFSFWFSCGWGLCMMHLLIYI